MEMITADHAMSRKLKSVTPMIAAIANTRDVSGIMSVVATSIAARIAPTKATNSKVRMKFL